jgi:Rod binding domain-containing protein
MAGLSAAALPFNVLMPPPVAAAGAGASAVYPTGALATASAAKRATIHKTAQDFEASFINAMLGPMFEGTSVSAPFGGGAGEEAFKSFMTEAMAKQMAARGGLGVASAVQREMLKLQGLK